MSNGVIRSEGRVRPTVIADLAALLPMRDEDRHEIEVSGRDATKALFESYMASKPNVFTILIDGEVSGIFGAAPSGDGIGVPWMLGNNRLKTIPRDLILQGRFWVNHFNQLYPHLENYVHELNRTSIRWLGAMDFTIHTEPYNLPNGHVFRRFTRDV